MNDDPPLTNDMAAEFDESYANFLESSISTIDVQNLRTEFQAVYVMQQEQLQSLQARLHTLEQSHLREVGVRALFAQHILKLNELPRQCKNIAHRVHNTARILECLLRKNPAATAKIREFTLKAPSPVRITDPNDDPPAADDPKPPRCMMAGEWAEKWADGVVAVEE